MLAAGVEAYQEGALYVSEGAPHYSPEPERLEFTDLAGAGYALKRPLVAMVSRDGGEYKVEYPPLELYAFSEDRGEAVREFVADFFDLCGGILEMDDSELGKGPKRWKDELSSLVAKNGSD